MSDQKVDVSDPSFSSLYKQLTDEKSPITWIAHTLNDDYTTLVPFEQGEGGFAEMKKKMSMNWAGHVVYGAFKVLALDHRGGGIVSKRLKVVAFSFVGGSVPEFQRARTSFQKGNVLPAVFPSSHLTIEVHARSLSDFTELAVAKKLQDNSGGHKPNAYSFLGRNGREISIEEINKGDDESDQEFDD